jgi:L-threonate 2-dehydrogenase
MIARKTPVGIMGVGLMGTACARRLLEGGFKVLGYDIDAAKCAQLSARGGAAVTTPAELARECDVIVLALFDTAQIEAAIEGEGGLLAFTAGRATPLTVICVSTCDPDRIAALAKRLPAEKLRFVEAPISGTSDQTARGDGLGLIAGDQRAVEAVSDVLQAICPRRHYLGEPGNGGRAKLAINLILGLNRTALGEGLIFAERMGLDPAAFLAVARESAAYSQIMDVKGPRMAAGEFSPPHGKLAQARKDVVLMHEQAQRRGQQLPLGRTYMELLDACLAAGEGDLDNCAVMQETRRRRVS